MKWTPRHLAVAVLGLVALAAPAAHAGGGAGGGGTTMPGFACYTIKEGVKQGTLVNLENQFGVLENVKVIRSRLLCTFANVSLVGGGEFDVPEGPLADHITCYSLRVPGPENVKVPVRISDGFDTEETLVRELQFLCVTSSKTVLDGSGDSSPD